MDQQASRKKKSFNPSMIMSKIFSTSSSKLSTDVKPTTETSVSIQSTANILIIGETGSGKSTFINYLTNYFLGGKYDAPRIAIPTRYHPKITESFGHCEKAIDDVTVSKTDACHQYLFHDSETDKQYLFLDTPGLGDTRGAQQDQTNIDTILNAINNLQGLTGVIIVANGSMARVTTNFRSVLLGLRGNLPDIVMDNVILILSHAKRHQSTFDIKKTLKMNGTAVYPYYMQNSAFAQDPTKWGAHEHEHIERDWTESMEEIRQMLSIINNFQTKSVAAFDDMRTIRNAIKTCMHEARLEITKVQQMHDEILAFEQAVKKYKNEEFSYQDYTQDQTVTVNELVDTDYHSTICSKCSFVCHENCSLTETEDIGNQIFQQCAAMNHENYCKRCPHNCSFSEHYHARKMMKTSEQKLTTVLHDIKAKFDIATKNKSNFEQKLTSAQDARKLIEHVLRQKIEAIQVQCRELRKVCGSFNLADELHILVEQLRIEARTLTSLEAQKQADTVIRELTMFWQKLEAEEQNITNMKSEMIVVDTGSGSEKTAAKFNANTRSKVQESNEKVTAVQKILETQLRKKKAPVVITNPTDSGTYEPIDEENQALYPQNYKPLPPPQRKLTSQRNEQPPQLPKRLPYKANNDYSGYAYAAMSTSNSNYGGIYSEEPTISNTGTRKYELMSIKELVDALHKAIAQNRPKAAIERELRNRAHGITCPMITNSDRAMFARYTSKYLQMEPSDISRQYMRLQQHVNSRLGHDDMNIEKIITIPSELLVELAVLYTLFSSKDTLTVEDDDREYQHESYRKESSPRTSETTRVRRSSESARQGFPGSQIYAELYSEENMNKPPSYNDAVGGRHEPLSPTRSGSMTMIEQIQTKESRTNYRRPTEREPPLSYPVRSNVDDDDGRYRTDSKSDLAMMTTDRLIELYSYTRKLDDTIQQVAIYNELDRRCNGEDIQLMTDPMMKSILAAYQQLERSILYDKLDTIKREIRNLTNGGNATQIKNIPKDMLIEITAIISLLRDQPVDTHYF